MARRPPSASATRPVRRPRPVRERRARLQRGARDQ